MDTERKILEAFLYSKKLKFSQIEKEVKVRSNKLSYHLTRMLKHDLLKKEGNIYQLSEKTEALIPYISNKTAVLPVLLIMIRKKNMVFLARREKRPFSGKLALPAGRLAIGESIKSAVKRIMKEKYQISATLSSVNSVSLEHVKQRRRPLHSFILILASARTKDKINYTDYKKEKKSIIASDYDMVLNNNNKIIKIREYHTKASKS